MGSYQSFWRVQAVDEFKLLAFDSWFQLTCSLIWELLSKIKEFEAENASTATKQKNKFHILTSFWEYNEVPSKVFASSKNMLRRIDWVIAKLDLSCVGDGWSVGGKKSDLIVESKQSNRLVGYMKSELLRQLFWKDRSYFTTLRCKVLTMQMELLKVQ